MYNNYRSTSLYAFTSWKSLIRCINKFSPYGINKIIEMHQYGLVGDKDLRTDSRPRKTWIEVKKGNDSHEVRNGSNIV